MDGGGRMKFAQTATVAVILAIGMIASAGLISKFLLKVRHERVEAIEVKGYAGKNVLSDIGKFTCRFSAEGKTLKEAYDTLMKSQASVLAYFRQKGFGEKEISIEAVNTNRVMMRDDKGKETNEVHHYAASQSVNVSSGNAELIRSTSTSVTELIQGGVDISADAPRFYVSDLKSIKLELLEAATRDGYDRARILAQNSGGRVGTLISAEQGVIQITERNSTDTSGGGVYDTSSIDKTAKVVVTLNYAVDNTKK